MLRGRAWKFGDDVDTDVIIPARHLTSIDPETLKAHCLEDLDPEFAVRVSPGDILVAGNNFGCGSSREHAPLAIKSAGVSCVIAKSFARIFFRNSFNIGLPILESAEAVEGIESGDELEVDLSSGTIRNLTRGVEQRAQAAPAFMQELLAAGNLLEFARRRIAEGKLKRASRASGEEPREEPEPKKERGARMQEIMAEGEPRGRDAPWLEDEEPPVLSEAEALAQAEDEEDD